MAGQPFVCRGSRRRPWLGSRRRERPRSRSVPPRRTLRALPFKGGGGRMAESPKEDVLSCSPDGLDCQDSCVCSASCRVAPPFTSGPRPCASFPASRSSARTPRSARLTWRSTRSRRGGGKPVAEPPPADHPCAAGSRGKFHRAFEYGICLGKQARAKRFRTPSPAQPVGGRSTAYGWALRQLTSTDSPPAAAPAADARPGAPPPAQGREALRGNRSGRLHGARPRRLLPFFLPSAVRSLEGDPHRLA
jgi:hypothetical protein